MGYFVDRVVICDAYEEPRKHYRLSPGGKTELVEARRPSMRFLASAKETRTGLTGVVGKQDSLMQDLGPASQHLNDFVNDLREEVAEWRRSRYKSGASFLTQRLLEWWFERDDERKAKGNRFFFCQREAVETVIYLFEVKNAQRMPGTGDLLRYALKLATGTGKTLVMALLITWSTLHRSRVAGSPLSSNFLIMVPNITVRDRVSGNPRGDGLDPAGTENLYAVFDTVPPEYKDDFKPNVVVRNWQSMSLDPQRSDWIPDDMDDEGKFVPASVIWALQRRRTKNPQTLIRNLIGNWRDLMIINDEAHHVYGEKRTKKGVDPRYIKWNTIVNTIAKGAKLPLVLDLSATPWYGSGSSKPEGTLFEWLVSDFSVYDAFESGLIKVVRLPEQGEKGRIYLDLWTNVKGVRTKEEYLSACRGAIEHIYSNWKEEYVDWSSRSDLTKGGSPVLLLVANDASRAKWLFEHVTKDYDLLRNPLDDNPKTWVTIQVDSKVFDAGQGKEAILREMVSTVGREGKLGQNVRCIISVNMLTEGWDVNSVTHILGVRAFLSPLLTEQVIGRGLRRSNYDVLNQPLEERPEGYEETMDAYGIPFVGFPVERKKRPKAGDWGHKPVWIETIAERQHFGISVPNVRSWAAGLVRSLSETIDVEKLPKLVIDPKETPPEVKVRAVIGNEPGAMMTFNKFREEYPLLKSAFLVANEILERTNPGLDEGLAVGPVFDELIEITLDYFARRLSAIPPMDLRDVGVWYWRSRLLDIIDTAVRESTDEGIKSIPILGEPDFFNSSSLKRFQWTGVIHESKKSPTILVPCHVDLEKQFASFLDSEGASDVNRYMKNERFGFSITYYEANRPRQYYPDFIVVQSTPSGEVFWLAETKGEIRPSTYLKAEAAERWCRKMRGHRYGQWNYVLVEQRDFEQALKIGVRSFGELAKRLRAVTSARILQRQAS